MSASAAFPVLADRLAQRREAILAAWRAAVHADGTLPSGAALPRVQLVDHLPALLKGFEDQLRQPEADSFQIGDAAAHGLHRWQQGYGLSEVVRELGHLNACVVDELERQAEAAPTALGEALPTARRLWARIYGVAVSASTTQYFKLEQIEAASHVGELEGALVALQALEGERAVLWEQAAHDLRGNLGVVSNATAGLGFSKLNEPARENFLHMLERNVQALHRLLDDVTRLARLQGGQDPRRLESLDVTVLLTQIGQDMRVMAETKGLSLHLVGEVDLRVQSDAVKLQRIVQNLVLNAVRYTSQGSVTLRWGDAGADDPHRWVLQIEDSGPGLRPPVGPALQEALETATDHAQAAARAARQQTVTHTPTDDAGLSRAVALSEGVDAFAAPGEGIGLSIVKRLCELLDATVQVESGATGTRFRILLPRSYPSEPPPP